MQIFLLSLLFMYGQLLISCYLLHGWATPNLKLTKSKLILMILFINEQERRSELESLDLAINMQIELFYTLMHIYKLLIMCYKTPAKRDSADSEAHAEMEHYMTVSISVLYSY